MKHALTLEQERAFLNFLDENSDFGGWRPLYCDVWNRLSYWRSNWIALG